MMIIATNATGRVEKPFDHAVLESRMLLQCDSDQDSEDDSLEFVSAAAAAKTYDRVLGNTSMLYKEHTPANYIIIESQFDLQHGTDDTCMFDEDEEILVGDLNPNTRTTSINDTEKDSEHETPTLTMTSTASPSPSASSLSTTR
jgi:hypothetical protein